MHRRREALRPTPRPSGRRRAASRARSPSGALAGAPSGCRRAALPSAKHLRRLCGTGRTASWAGQGASRPGANKRTFQRTPAGASDMLDTRAA
eukprot:364274-Chlamydomonas_euryale.AAC.4